MRANCLAPGPIEETEGFTRLLAGLPSETVEATRQSIPLQRMGTCGDVSSAALFLVSDASRYVTGTTLVVDGGSWMTLGTGPLRGHAPKL